MCSSSCGLPLLFLPPHLEPLPTSPRYLLLLFLKQRECTGAFLIAISHSRRITQPSNMCKKYDEFAVATVVVFLFLIVGVSVVALPWILENRPRPGTILIALIVLLFTISTLSGIRAAFMEPGIIPRSETTPASAFNYPDITERIIVYEHRPLLVKYCTTCRIWRPPRASHCSICDNCVLRFDHHCPWLGNDIGLRNYRTFLCFIMSATLFEALATITSVLAMYWETQDLSKSPEISSHADAFRKALGGGTAVNFVTIIVGSIALLFTGKLLLLHLHLIWLNHTTVEKIKDYPHNFVSDNEDERRGNSIYLVLFSQCQPSLINGVNEGASYPGGSEIQELVERQAESQGRITKPEAAAIV